jgi:hypothetical protein
MSKKQTCFCSYCRNERTYLAKKHIQILEIVFLLIPSVLLSFIFWQSLDPRLLIFWVLLSFAVEITSVIRWRIAVVCKYCGFDPVIYVKDPAMAAEKVTNFMKERKNSTTFLLSSKQFHQLPRRKIQKSIYNNTNKSANT